MLPLGVVCGTAGASHRGRLAPRPPTWPASPQPRQILPKLVASAEARRKAEERAALYEAMPKKRSERVVTLAKKKEEDEEQRKAAKRVGGWVGRSVLTHIGACGARGGPEGGEPVWS